MTDHMGRGPDVAGQDRSRFRELGDREPRRPTSRRVVVPGKKLPSRVLSLLGQPLIFGREFQVGLPELRGADRS